MPEPIEPPVSSAAFKERLGPAFSVALAASLVLHTAFPLVTAPRAQELPSPRVEVALHFVDPKPEAPEEKGVQLQKEAPEAEPPPEVEPETEGPTRDPGEAGAEGEEPEAPAEEATDEAPEPLPVEESALEPERAPEPKEAPPRPAEAPPPAPPPAAPPTAPPSTAPPSTAEPKQVPGLSRLEKQRLVQQRRRPSRLTQVALAERRAKRLREFRERRERARKLALERMKRRGRGKGGKGKGKKSGRGKKRPIPPELKQGRPDEVWACEADGRGIRAEVREEEPITEWVSLIPTVMFAFDTEPGLGEVMDGVTRIVKRRRRHVPRAGPVELALPATAVEVPFEDPTGVKAYLGRSDARCLVGFRWNGKELWPLLVTRVPARVVDSSGHEFQALVDVTFHEDATFELKPHHGPAELPFTAGRLEGGDGIENTIASHTLMAETAQTVASWFGVDLRKTSRARKKAEEQRRRKEQQRKLKKDLELKRQRLAAARQKDEPGEADREEKERRNDRRRGTRDRGRRSRSRGR